MNYLQKKEKIFQATNSPQIIKQGKLKFDYDDIKINYYLRNDGIYIPAGGCRVYGIIIPENARKFVIDNGNIKIATFYHHSFGVAKDFNSSKKVLGTTNTTHIEIDIQENYIGKMLLLTSYISACDISKCHYEFTA